LGGKNQPEKKTSRPHMNTKALKHVEVTAKEGESWPRGVKKMRSYRKGAISERSEKLWKQTLFRERVGGWSGLKEKGSGVRI